jgi:hypothetical protein
VSEDSRLVCPILANEQKYTMNPFSAQDVSAPAQIIQLDDDHWSIAGYESHLGAQGVPAAGPFMATNLGVYVNVSPGDLPLSLDLSIYIRALRQVPFLCYYLLHTPLHTTVSNQAVSLGSSC